MVRIIFSEGQNLASVFDFRDIIATFRVENTSNSWSFKTKKTIFKELQHTFQKGKRNGVLSQEIVWMNLLEGLKLTFNLEFRGHISLSSQKYTQKSTF